MGVGVVFRSRSRSEMPVGELPVPVRRCRWRRSVTVH